MKTSFDQVLVRKSITTYSDGRITRGRPPSLGLFVLMLGLLTGCFGSDAPTESDAAGAPPPTAGGRQSSMPVVTTPAAERYFEERLVVQGNLEAKHFAMAAARLDGTLDAVFVDEGDAVVADETPLFQTDKVTIEKALEISRLDLAVARCAKRETHANLERVEADFLKAKLDYERFKRLREQDAVTVDALELQESRYKQTHAGVKHAKAVVDVAQETERQAEAAVVIAQKTLSDSLVYAPISGKVSLRLKEPGEFCGAGKPVVRIDDPKVIEVSAFLPAQYYARVHVDDTPVRVRVYGIDAGELALAYKSPTIHPKLRTFEVKCVLTNPPDGVVPGAMAQIEVVLEQHTAVGVPSAALQFRGGRPVVFVVENDVAREVAVETGIETGGWTELRPGPVSPGTPVVTMGQYLLDDGTSVAVREADAAGPEGA